MHYAKYQKAAVSSVLMHSDRGQDGKDTHEHSNENIDRSRTHLNYELKDRGGLTAYAYYKQRIEQIAAETKERTGKGIRKDAVTLCSWAVTVPKSLPEDKQAAFFKAVYDWFADRYGEDNIVTAAVHRDETTPHLHFQFTPIIERDGVRKLCAKDMETPKTLRTVHPKLEKHLTETLGCKVELMNGATDNGNKTIQQLKVEQLKEQLGELASTGAARKLIDKALHGKRLTEQEQETLTNIVEALEVKGKLLDQRTAEAEAAKSASDSSQERLQEALSNVGKQVQAEAQRLTTGIVERSKSEAAAVKKQAATEIDKIRQERDRAVQQQAALQEQLRRERERSEEAIELATDYAYLADEAGIPEHLKELDGEYWERLQALKQPEQKRQQQRGKGSSYPSLD